MKKFIASLLLAATLAMGGCDSSRTFIINRAMNSVTHIVDGPATCSGFVIKPNLVLSAAHCFTADITVDGKVPVLLHHDQYFDLVLLQVDTQRPALRLRAREVVVGEAVYGLGYGFALAQPLFVQKTVLLTGAAITPQYATGIITEGPDVGGISGGPVIDTMGNVVSINQHGKEGHGHSVPVVIIKAFLYDAGIVLN